MSGPGSSVLRSVRAAAFSTSAVSLALAAHTVAGGHRPDALALAAALVGLGCASAVWVSSGRRAGRLGTTAALALTQAGLHTWFSLTGGHGCDVRGLVLTGHHHLDVAGCSAGAAHGSGLGWPSLAMTSGHLVALALTGLLVARGERALHELGVLAAARLRPFAPALPGPVALARVVPTDRAAGLRPVVLGVRLRLRGPPAPLVRA